MSAHGREQQRDRHKLTVHDLGTAFQIAGGSGTDTITAQGFAFTADQRNAISPPPGGEIVDKWHLYGCHTADHH